MNRHPRNLAILCLILFQLLSMPVRAVIDQSGTHHLQNHCTSISIKDLDRVYSITNQTLNRQQTFTYTANGQRQSHTIHNIVTGATKTTGYSYDGLNRLSSINSWTGDDITYSYNEDSSRNVVNLPNNLTLNHSYDSLGRLTGMEYENSNGQPLASFDYTLDISGNRTSMQDNEGVTDYTFDNLNRLTRVDYPDSTFEQFAFDNGSRRIHHEDETGSTSYLYNLGDRLLATTGQNPASFNYDLNGNLTEKTNNEGTYQYSYSARDRLRQVTTPDGSSESYRYYPLSDLRYSLTKNNDSSNTEKYLYGGPNVIEELKQINGTDNVTVASYIEGLSIDEHLGRVVHDTTGQGNQDTVYAYITDPLGTIRNLVDSTESIVNTYDYKAYGNIRNQTENVPNPYRFTGRRWSDTTKDYYYRARHYMPDLGMFGAVDRYAPGEMTYGYVNGNPVMGRDPRGEGILTIALAGIAVVSIVSTAIVAYEGAKAGIQQGKVVYELSQSLYTGSDPCIKELEYKIYSLTNPYGFSVQYLPIPDYIKLFAQINDLLAPLGLEAKITLPSNLIFRDDLDYEYDIDFNQWAKIFSGGLASFRLYKQGRNAWEQRKHKRGKTQRDYRRESDQGPPEGAILDPKQDDNYPKGFKAVKTVSDPVNDSDYKAYLQREHHEGRWSHVTETNTNGEVITYVKHEDGWIVDVSKPH